MSLLSRLNQPLQFLWPLQSLPYRIQTLALHNVPVLVYRLQKHRIKVIISQKEQHTALLTRYLLIQRSHFYYHRVLKVYHINHLLGSSYVRGQCILKGSEYIYDRLRLFLNVLL